MYITELYGLKINGVQLLHTTDSQALRIVYIVLKIKGGHFSMKKWLVGLFMSLALVFALAACSDGDNENANADGDSDGDGGDSNHLEQMKEDGKATIGFADEKPYAYEEDGELKGVAVDVATEILNELGVDEIDGQLADFGELIPGLQANKYDLITASMAITPDRCENVEFGEPEVVYGEGLVVAEGNPENLHSYEDIAADSDLTVNIMAGATEIDFVQDEGVDESQIEESPDIPATFSAIEAGRADATTGTEMTVKMAYESADSENLEWVEDFEQPDINGVPSYGAAAFHQDHDEFREAYNEVLAEFKETDEYDEILEDNYFDPETNAVDNEITTDMVCSEEVYEDR